ncbi:response regulator transcription factor [Rugosimonospora africana]|uniref:DNA-binding response regulator n=1 Tax=Rugosimonospora africana TaxID=556532 RepID=A0A8J3QMZ6_9ACTN|nr:response regulator transcription factor [Rugosimonospora africana]GIH13998.1 DNA-binding response regulator [Rugosimonospora africana]
MRAAVARLLSEEEDLQVIAELADAEAVYSVATRVRPSVVLLDHALPGTLTVSEVCEKLCAALPDCAVLTLLDRRSSATMLEILTRLVPRVGILTEEATPSELIDGIRQIARGIPVLDARLTVVALTYGNSPLTQRERDVLRRASGGTPVKEIAAEMFLSCGTVRNYLSSSITKTGARTRIEAIRIAHEAGWI